ncbi:MAG: oligosaccharide flippase family protein [Syntrophaceae bacterium]|nr:oligosaccharide flippase family protein [Syntrophaceae bacterium]
MKSTETISASRPQLQNIFARLRKSSFVKNVLVVMSGSAVAQVIGFALIPIISRLFSPSDFGVLGSFQSVFSIIAAGATLQYTQAIMLPKEKEDALNLFFVSCLCTLAVGSLLLIFCMLAPASVNNLMKTDGVWALALLVVATVVAGLNQSCGAWCVRAKAFKHTAASQVILSVSEKGTQIGFGYLKAGAAGLIVSSVLATILASLNLVRVLLPDLWTLRRFIRWERMKQLARDYRDFPMYAASQNVINALSSGLPVLFLSHFYGIDLAGAYAFGVRILWTPMSFFIGALRQVLFQKAAETQNQGHNLAPLYVKITVGLFALVFFPSMVFFVWAPEIFIWIFGSQWHTAGELAKFLVLWMMVVFCNLPAVVFARIIRIQRTVFFYDLVLLAARILALVLGGLYLTASQCILLFSLVGAAMNLFLIILVGHAVIKKEEFVNLERIKDCLMEE